MHNLCQIADFKPKARVTKRLIFQQRLTLAELNASTSTTQTGLFTLFHTRVTGQIPAFTKCFVECFVVADKSTRQSHANRSALARRPAAVDSNQHVYFVAEFNRRQRCLDGLLILLVYKVLFERLFVDRDFAAAITYSNSSNAAFATTGAQCVTVNLVFLDRNHESIVFG